MRGTGVANNQLRQTFGEGVAHNQLRQTLGEGEKSIREFFTKIHQTPWDTSVIYIPIIPLFEGFSTFWHVFLDEKRRR